MTDRQRAFISSLVYTYKNQRFTNYHRLGVKRMPDGARMYEFKGEWLLDSLSIQDDKYNKAYDSRFYQKPYGLELTWVGKRRSETLKLRLPDGSHFYGQDGEYFRFEGWYYKPSDKVEIRDSSQDKDKYAYRVTW